MAKTYTLPTLSSSLLQRIAAFGYHLERKSKDCIKLMPSQDEKLPFDGYKRYYVFHIDFAAGECSGMNISEHVSGYKRATIWLRDEELKLLLDIKNQITQSLELGEFLP